MDRESRIYAAERRSGGGSVKLLQVPPQTFMPIDVHIPEFFKEIFVPKGQGRSWASPGKFVQVDTVSRPLPPPDPYGDIDPEEWVENQPAKYQLFAKDGVLYTNRYTGGSPFNSRVQAIPVEDRETPDGKVVLDIFDGGDRTPSSDSIKSFVFTLLRPAPPAP
jgi:hypothetical protein